MELIISSLSQNQSALENGLNSLPSEPGQLCFFDIETTGLSPKISSVYLIGAAVWKNNGFQIVQWFADDYVSEKELLLSFSEFCSPIRTFIHYNGASFDIPYLEKKYKEYKLDSPFQDKEGIDLFRSLPKNKSFFPVPDRKLTTMEKLLSFSRTDTFSGKDCIRLYTEFMHKKYFRDPLAKERKEQLLRHNYDDIQGLILCAQLFSYRYGIIDPYSVKWELQAENHPFVKICGRLSHGYFPLALRHTAQDGTGLCYIYEGKLFSIQIPLISGTLRHYFNDYKNYYYLPEEDTAIHKSVGTYVDKDYRRQATADTCYVKKSGNFLTLPDRFPADDLPLFRETRKSHPVFMDSDSFSALPQDRLFQLLEAYFHTAPA